MKTVVTYICKDKSVIIKKYDYYISVHKLNYEPEIDAIQIFEDKEGIMQIIITKR